MHKPSLSIAIALLSVASAANAEVIDSYWEFVDGDPAVSGSVQNTLFTSMSADWTNSLLEVDLATGSILDPVSAGLGHNLRAAGNADDSWIDAPNNANSFTVTPLQWMLDMEGVNTTRWFDTEDNGAVTDGVAARMYASDDASGTWRFLQFDADSAGIGTEFTGFVVNGEFQAVPEPAGAALLGLAAVTALGAVRRKVR